MEYNHFQQSTIKVVLKVLRHITIEKKKDFFEDFWEMLCFHATTWGCNIVRQDQNMK